MRQVDSFLYFCRLICKLLIYSTNLGNVYIADTDNNRIRKVTVSTGIITTIAGINTNGYSGDNGAATSATLYWPFGVALDASGRQFLVFLSIDM